MKKTLCLLLVLLTLSGCGERGGETPDDFPAITVQIADAMESGPQVADVMESAPQAADVSEPPASETPDSAPAATPQAADVPESVPTEAAETESGESQNRIPDFTTTDLEGNTVTQDVFLGKDLTVVNVWGTYCGPCINEMPELGEWAAEMPDNVQLLGVVCDLMTGDEGETLELARDIVARTGANYPSIAMCDDLAWIAYGIQGVPTTFFVNGNGEIVGEAILGAYVDRYKTQVEALLNGNER